MPDPEHTYRRFLGRSVSAERGRQQLSQRTVAERMQALGFTDWRQQTLANVEKGRRYLKVEELLGLAMILQTTIRQLMTPLEDNPAVMTLPQQGGLEVPTDEVRLRVIGSLAARGESLEFTAVTWDGDKPVWETVRLGERREEG